MPRGGIVLPCKSGGAFLFAHIVLGLLHILYSCVNMLFWRVFMRISYTCPEHLKFALTVEKWTQLVQLTGDAIDWLDANEKMYDVWMLVAYCATSCALVQVRRPPPRLITPPCRSPLSRRARLMYVTGRLFLMCHSTTPSRVGKTRKPRTS